MVATEPKGHDGMSSPDAALGMGEAVEIVAYDPAWPAEFEHERALIARALGDLMLGIEHVGSTAVAGLGAKPIIDIMIAVHDLADGERCVRPLEALGYEYRGDAGIPGRLFFARPTPRPRTHHLNMVEQGSDFWHRLLLFRDYLRDHPQEADRYYRLKVRLAAQFRDDRVGYTEAKTKFIESALARARGTEPGGTGPSAGSGHASACRQPEACPPQEGLTRRSAQLGGENA